METNKFFYWLRVGLKWLILLSFFIIAAAEGKAFWLAGVMTIFTIVYYVLLWRGIGEKRK